MDVGSAEQLTPRPGFLGITILADYILSDGPEVALDSIAVRAGATAVATNPTVTAASPVGVGSFQPPDDAGSSPRLFDRPLFGRRSLWVRSECSYVPNRALYPGPYPARRTGELTATHGKLIDDFLAGARARGLESYFQVGASQPPDLRDEDIPRLPDGTIPGLRVANVASLASEAVRAYNRAYVQDLFERYPDLDGIRIDWPEYPCYCLDEAFQDFGRPVKEWSERNGFDFESIRRGVLEFRRELHGAIVDSSLDDLTGPDRGAAAIAELLMKRPAIAEWLRLKAALSTDLIRDWRAAVREFGGPGKKLSVNAFMSPLNLLTGLDYAAAAEHSDSISPKLYTMHWMQIVAFWGEALAKANPKVCPDRLARAIASLLGVTGGAPELRLADYRYPDPEEPHRIDAAVQRSRLERVCRQIAGRVPVYALVHGYGPLDDFQRRFRLAARSCADGVWINREGYLSDAKLDAVRREWLAAGRG